MLEELGRHNSKRKTGQRYKRINMSNYASNGPTRLYWAKNKSI